MYCAGSSIRVPTTAHSLSPARMATATVRVHHGSTRWPGSSAGTARQSQLTSSKDDCFLCASPWQRPWIVSKAVTPFGSKISTLASLPCNRKPGQPLGCRKAAAAERWLLVCLMGFTSVPQLNLPQSLRHRHIPQEEAHSQPPQELARWARQQRRGPLFRVSLRPCSVSSLFRR